MRKTIDTMRLLPPTLLLCLVSACATPPTPTGTTYDSAKKEMAAAARVQQAAAQSENVGKALLPPLTVEMPKVDGRPIEPRFDLAVNNAPATVKFSKGNVFGQGTDGTNPLPTYVVPAANVALNPQTISLVGGSQSHANIQPCLAVNYCIATTGIYPSRN